MSAETETKNVHDRGRGRSADDSAVSVGPLIITRLPTGHKTARSFGELMSSKPRKKNTRGRSEDGSPNPVDVHVGGRIRLRRTLLGLSQEKLGEQIGLTFQQVQKYERGANRVGASRLYDLARILEVPVGYFFDDLADELKNATPIERQELDGSSDDDDPMHRRETLEMVRAYYRVPRERRKKLFELIKAMAVEDESAKRGHTATWGKTAQGMSQAPDLTK